MVMLFRSFFRTVRQSMGRFLAILSIMALGVGFFAGLRVTERAMLRTADGYVRDLALYDLRLLSTYGLTDGDVAAFAALPGVTAAVGSHSVDFLRARDDGTEAVFHAHSLSPTVNRLDLVTGRLPEAPDECVLDAKYASPDAVGQTVRLSDGNPDDTRAAFAYGEYTVVGTVNAVTYLNFERGSSALGNGAAAGFVYLLPEGFASDVYTEIFLTVPPAGEIYSDAYRAGVDAVRGKAEALLSARAEERFDTLRADATAAIEEKEAMLNAMAGMLPADKAAEYRREIAEAREKVTAMEAPLTYVLDRTANVGYASFENDTAIVSGVAQVFPLFFFLVAALVCLTTMTRMVSEERTQIGVLKALGYGSGAIAARYLGYAGAASLVGCTVGFLLGSRLLPLALWQVYHIMYSIARPVAYVLDAPLYVLCTALYLFCALGATYLVCRHELRDSAAAIMRPAAPAAGKRVFLERIPLVWRHLPFLHKVSVRNILRYKRRLFMMILGIGGCTALLLTGFGIRDSIRPVVDNQYNEIELYDASVTFRRAPDEAGRERFLRESADATREVRFLYAANAKVAVGGGEKEVHLAVFDGAPDGFVRLHSGGRELSYPGRGEAAVNARFASENGIAVGDRITCRDGDGAPLSLTVSAIFDNYIYDYLYIDATSYDGAAPAPNTAYVHFAEGADAHEAGATLLSADNVASVSLVADMRARVGSMLQSLDYIVLIVLVCAGALSFIVLYNLTNITIIERTREIATLKVLGFFRREQNAYVFRENLILTGISALCGLPMGVALHRYVMAQIRISTISFGHALAPLSFVLAVAITFVFTLLVDLALLPKTRHINMAEAMKAVE